MFLDEFLILRLKVGHSFCDAYTNCELFWIVKVKSDFENHI